MKIKDAIKVGIHHLSKVNIDSASLDAELLLAHSLELNRLDLILRADEKLSDFEFEKFLTFIMRRANYEPFAYIVGYKEFWGREFIVSSHTLIPRPETEFIIEYVLKHSVINKKINILDLGTGSGCIGITLAMELENAYVYMVDISLQTLAVTQSNIQKYNAKRVSLINSNWLQSVPPMLFDYIVANPPYIPYETKLMPDVINFEPHKALFADNYGLSAYQEIAITSKHYLHNHGSIVLEIGIDQSDAVTNIFKEQGFKLINAIKDLNEIIRVLVFQLLR